MPKFLKLAFICGLGLVIPAWAHHSFSAEFDGSRTIVVKGVLAKVDWTNAHIAIYLDTQGPGGKTRALHVFQRASGHVA